MAAALRKDGSYSNLAFHPPKGMPAKRCQQLEMAIARGLTDDELADKLGATERELAVMHRRMEQFA